MSEHWVVFVEFSILLVDCFYRNAKLLCECFCFSWSFSLYEFVKRWVKETDCYRASFHCLDDFVEVLLLKWEDSLEVSLASFSIFRNDHLLE